MDFLPDQTTSRGTTRGDPLVDEEYPLHPNAKPMPPMSEGAFAALKAGIAALGPQVPIKVQKGTNYLIDGRHRLRACRELGIEPLVDEIEVLDERVWSYTGCEASRRDGLDSTEKALFAVEHLLPECERQARERRDHGHKLGQGEEGGKASERAANLAGANRGYVERLIWMRKHHPEVYERLRKGEIKNVCAAEKEAKGRAGKKKEERPQEGPRVAAYLLPDLEAVKAAEGLDTVSDVIGWFIEGWKARRGMGAAA